MTVEASWFSNKYSTVLEQFQCRSRQHGLPMGQCLSELFVYKLYSMYCGSLLLVLLALRAVTGTGYLVS
jgi:hypothetical protein